MNSEPQNGQLQFGPNGWVVTNVVFPCLRRPSAQGLDDVLCQPKTCIKCGTPSPGRMPPKLSIQQCKELAVKPRTCRDGAILTKEQSCFPTMGCITQCGVLLQKCHRISNILMNKKNIGPA